MNLCNQGNIVNIDLASKFYFKQKKTSHLIFFKIGAFRSNNTDYFIEPDYQFKELKNVQGFLDKSIIKTEVSYALIDNQIITFKTHIIHTKARDFQVFNSTDSCLLLR